MRFSNLVGTIALLIAIYILWQIRFIVLLAFAAVALATAINYLVHFLMRLGIKKRGIAIVVSLALLILIFAGFIFIVVPPFVDQLQQAIDLFPQAVDEIQIWFNWLQEKVPEQLVGEIQRLENVTRNLPSLASRVIGNFYSIFTGSLGALLNILLVTVITIMLLTTPHPYMRLYLAFFPSFYRRRAAQILKKCETALVGWTKGILFNMLVITVLSWLGLTILGVKLPLANALLAGLLTFIPNIGPVLSCIPPIILALLDAPWKALAVLILYILIQQVESNILTPLVMKQQVSLLPAVTLLAQATFAIFFGFIGLFLALPLAVVAQVWINEVLIKDILSNWNGKKQRLGSKSAKNPFVRHQTSQTSPQVFTTEISFSDDDQISE
ncbi:AI-2E family transporter [Myxosarcina sp. GI1]|uniref:AI-2E family transporter n=1 Tax=Myxosarcina sp. GI1 TaxID=1541065 RepID=UPI00055AFC3A|nr:AI-2E family transporter [Myxosarcina sp. GI1]